MTALSNHIKLCQASSLTELQNSQNKHWDQFTLAQVCFETKITQHDQLQRVNDPL